MLNTERWLKNEELGIRRTHEFPSITYKVSFLGSRFLPLEASWYLIPDTSYLLLKKMSNAERWLKNEEVGIRIKYESRFTTNKDLQFWEIL